MAAGPCLDMSVSWRGRFAPHLQSAAGDYSMVIALLVAGIVAILAGIPAIAYGFLLELSFGNTLILAGVVAVCSGIIVLAQAVVVRELRNIAGRLDPRRAEEELARPVLSPVVPKAAREAGESSRDQAARTGADAAAPPPWREQAALRERPRQEAPVPPPEEAEPAPQRRRNLLFSSNVRKERERGQMGADEPNPPDRPSPATPEAPRPGFEAPWPRPERPRPGELPPRRVMRTPPALGEPDAGSAEAARPPESPQSEELPAVTVVKSGVVDGMAYSLYSDGSIEAQMPEGMMRFASIEELRAHLDHRE